MPPLSPIIPLSSTRLLVVAPHPDDEVLAAAGLIQRVLSVDGAVRVIFCTDGENNPWPQRAVEKRWRIRAEDRDRFGLRRRYEALAGLGSLGVGAEAVRYLGLPDQGITPLLRSASARPMLALGEEIEQWRPTLLVGPSLFDLHPDHAAMAMYLAAAIEHSMRDEVSQWTYLIHGRGPQKLKREDFRLTPGEMERKREAILCHRTQLVLSRRRFLGFARPVERFYQPIPVPESWRRSSKLMSTLKRFATLLPHREA